MKIPLKQKAALLILAIVPAISLVATFVGSRMIRRNVQEIYTRQAVHLEDTITVILRRRIGYARCGTLCRLSLRTRRSVKV